ncbi:hypothetical protein NP233_g2182 [Leucocoprinus birnbaumii]|uniref:Uncharacterized protein n=1 Tax=Leucocoprinus birnbaumii TaxID=56174 RepID=A0AAD5W4U7_9AGAR|nr:hypothetical protein NP233_g2182 [Leucocoprinus birnbaumii]
MHISVDCIATTIIATIIPLRAPLQRFAPDPLYLTTLHPSFLHLCIAQRHSTDSLPIFQHPVTNLNITEMTKHDNLMRHGLGGIALVAF